MGAMADLTQVRQLIQQARRRHLRRRPGVRGERVPYYRRGELSIPAFRMAEGGEPEVDGRDQSFRLMGKAAVLPVDFFFYDLEDMLYIQLVRFQLIKMRT